MCDDYYICLCVCGVIIPSIDRLIDLQMVFIATTVEHIRHIRGATYIHICIYCIYIYMYTDYILPYLYHR